MSTGWTLRRADAADADALSLVATAAFLETYAGVLAGVDILAHCREKLTPAAFRVSITRTGSELFLAEQDPGGAPIGYATLTISDLPLAAATDLELLRLYVLAPWHGSGLGAAMMTTVGDAARVRGATRLLLGVYHGNARARRFYERLGFAIVGGRPFQVGAIVHQDPVYALAL